MNATTQKLATKAQIRKIETVGQDAIASVLDELNPTKAGAQRVLESDEFSSAMRQAAETALATLLVTDKYADEEVDSKYGYLSGYKPLPLTDQVARLKELYPQLKDAQVPEVGELPKGAEGWFAIPNIWKEDSLLIGTYNDSLRRVLEMVKSDRDGKFHNYRDGQIGPDRLRQTARCKAIFEKLSEDQGHPDILVIAAQFGLAHRGRSVRRAREVMLDQNQFGLGAFVTGIMVLTHPDRLKHYDDLWIDCAGDEYDVPDAGGRFDRAPCFKFYDGEVKFGTSWTDGASGFYGSASGFLSQ